MYDGVIDSGINFLSFDRARELVPPEYLYAYDYFQEHEGEVFDWLPMGEHAPNLPTEITLASQAGIHTPSYSGLDSRGASKEHYALSIHSQGSAASPNAPYPDMDIIRRPDGTWTFDYCAHKPTLGARNTKHYNENMMNNLRDGVPVAVYIRYPGKGYVNYGLAYVERYDPLTDMFTLHGPVSAEMKGIEFSSIISKDQLTEEEIEIFKLADSGDARKKVLVEQVRREKQSEFRQRLLAAYSGSCAVTGVDVPEVLQAAHIDPYRGKQSQVVTNGLLLRSDIHLLYDAHLITVLPEKNLIRVNKQLENSYYHELDGQKINVPSDPQLKPDDSLLEIHLREFESIAKRISAA